MNQLLKEITEGLKSRRFKEAAAIMLCIVSAVGGWFDLRRGAQFGDEAATIGLIWNFAYRWLTGWWWPSTTERNMTMADVYSAAKAGRLPTRNDSALARIILLGSIAFFLMLLYWIFSGAWLR